MRQEIKTTANANRNLKKIESRKQINIKMDLKIKKKTNSQTKKNKRRWKKTNRENKQRTTKMEMKKRKTVPLILPQFMSPASIM